MSKTDGTTGAGLNSLLVFIAVAATAAADLQPVLERVRVAQDVPGVSVVVTHADEILFAGASGVADLESRRPMTTDTILYAGSLTKVLTAVLTLRLVEEGHLSFDDVVIEVPAGPGKISGEISVMHLLMHTSGLNREGDFGYWFNADFPDAAELSRYLSRARLRAAPGTAAHYSNIGFAALGQAIERAAGQPYGASLKSLLLIPLGMNASGPRGPAPKVAAGYTPVGRLIPSERRPFAGVGRSVGTRHVREYHDAEAMAPAFGAYTSALDLSRLARFLLGHGGDEILSVSMRRKMLTPQRFGRGLGLRVGRYKGRPVARHDGWFAAHRSHLLIDPEAAIAVVVLANSDSAAPDDIAEALFDVAFEVTR